VISGAFLELAGRPRLAKRNLLLVQQDGQRNPIRLTALGLLEAHGGSHQILGLFRRQRLGLALVIAAPPHFDLRNQLALEKPGGMEGEMIVHSSFRSLIAAGAQESSTAASDRGSGTW
jgi:hypothetical protein